MTYSTVTLRVFSLTSYPEMIVQFNKNCQIRDSFRLMSHRRYFSRSALLRQNRKPYCVKKWRGKMSQICVGKRVAKINDTISVSLVLDYRCRNGNSILKKIDLYREW